MSEKKEKTPTQKKKQYKAIQYTCFGCEFLSVIMPFIIIGAVNFNEYFVEYDGVKMSLAAALAFALMGIAVWLVSKEKFGNSFITLMVGWAAVTGIFFLLGDIINDIAYIMLFGFIGIAGAYGLDIGSKQAKKKADEIQKGIDLAKEQMTSEAYKEEVNTQKVKVKVKK